MSGLAENETVVTGGHGIPPLPEDPADQTQALPKPPGRPRIGKYEIVKPIGRGGMGAVYRAFDPVLEREVALKVMLPETAGDPEQKQRFEREARAVARLSHPGIVTVFDLGYHTDGSPYIVMELLKGQDLLARLREAPPLSLGQKVSIVTQVLDGLGHAHKAGIVHRDIKPANVFLIEEGAARIMDFGIAFCTSSGATSRTVLGTVSYMSPEQVRGELVDGRSDLFSVGTLLHEILTGRRPFDAETPMATFYRIARGEAVLELPPGREYQGFLPVLRRALSAGVEERYPTAAEFAAALRACTDSGVATEAGAHRDLAHDAVVDVADEHVAEGIDRNAFGRRERGARRGTAIAFEAVSHPADAGEIADHAGAEIHPAHAVVVDVGDVEDVAGGAQRDAEESGERGARRRPTVTVVAERAVASDGRDDPVRADPAHAVVVGVRDVHRAVGGDRHPAGRTQPGRSRGAAIAGGARGAGAGDRRHVSRERRRGDIDRHRADQSEKHEQGDYRNPPLSSCAGPHPLPPVSGVSRAGGRHRHYLAFYDSVGLHDHTPNFNLFLLYALPYMAFTSTILYPKTVPKNFIVITVDKSVCCSL